MKLERNAKFQLTVFLHQDFILILTSQSQNNQNVKLIIEILTLIIQRKVAKNARAINEKFIVHNSTSYSILQELISNVKNVITIKGKLFFLRKYIFNEKELIKSDINLELINSLGTSLNKEINPIINSLILGFGGYMVINNSMTLGGLIIFINYSGRLLGPLDLISKSYIQLQQVLISVNRIRNFSQIPLDIKQDNRGNRVDSIIGEIKFENVKFSYEDDKSVLNNINMTFKHGQITCIVGCSGSGKTTLINLLMSFLDVSSREILLYNINIREFNLLSLRSKIAIVSQNTILFDDTLINNLTLNNKNISFERVIDCVKQADAYGFIMELPNAFNTLIGENGLTLSGG